MIPYRPLPDRSRSPSPSRPQSRVPSPEGSEEGGNRCLICYNTIAPANTVFLECMHSYCLGCIAEWRRRQLDVGRPCLCSVCQRPMSPAMLAALARRLAPLPVAVPAPALLLAPPVLPVAAIAAPAPPVRHCCCNRRNWNAAVPFIGMSMGCIAGSALGYAYPAVPSGAADLV